MKTTNTKNKPNPLWLGGANPAAIENQEKEGQQEFVASLHLPKVCNSPKDITNTEAQYRKMGIQVFTSSKNDDIFLGVKLPDGWKKKETNHSMWSKLLDEKGRERASIFYKAAFYDRDAFINFTHRITYAVDRVGYLNNDYSKVDGVYISDKTPFVGRVVNSEKQILFETEPADSSMTEYNSNIALTEQCLKFLRLNYPNYKDVNAYWD